MNRKLLLLAILLIVGAWGKTYAQGEEITFPNSGLTSLDGWDYGDPKASTKPTGTNDGVFNEDKTVYYYQQWRGENTETMVPAIEFYHAWSGNAAGQDIGDKQYFHFSQKITLPAGNYRLKVNAFYREGNAGGKNEDKAWIFAGEKKQNVAALTPSDLNSYTGDDMDKARAVFKAGKYANEFDFDVEEEQEIEIGFRGYIDTYCSWCILGPVSIFKYSLDDFIEDYMVKYREAQNIVDQPMNATVKAELQAAMVDPTTFRLKDDVTAAEAALTEKLAAANASVSDYAATNEAFKTYDKKAANLDAAGKSAYDTAVDAVKRGYADGSMVGNQAEAVKAAYQEALKKQTAVGSDFTECAPAQWDGQNGTEGQYGKPERYNASNWNPPYEYSGDVMTQTISGLPEGAYKVVLNAAASFTSGRGFECKTGDDLAVVFANTQTVNLPVIDRVAFDNVSDVAPYEVIGKVGADGVLKYGIQKLDEIGGNWFVVELVSITKVEYIPVESITASDLTVEQLKTAEIGAVVAPANATLPTMTYVSADETIATVDAKGVVTGVVPGKTTITITADDIEKVINVTVTEPAVMPKNIVLTPAEFALDLGANNTATLTTAVEPAEANQAVTFVSSDPEVATINEKGEIIATGLGTAVITVSSVIAPDVTATASVAVNAAEAPALYAETIEDGIDYWIVNAATGKFLGGANIWGTRPSLIEHGIPFKAAKIEDDVYTLDSYTSSGGNSHFLTGEWIDGAATPFTILPASNGAFTINYFTAEKDVEGNDISVMRQLRAKTSNTMVDGVDAISSDDLFAQWYFISRDQLVEGLNAATPNSPVDATFLIKDFNFSRNNTLYSAWEKSDGITNAQNPGASDGSHDFNWNVERYHNVFNMSQAVAVPNGTYRLTAQGFYRQDGEDNDNLPYFFANDQVQEFPLRDGSENSMNEAAASFSKGLYKIAPITIEVTDHVLNIGAINDVNTALWCIWDNFELEAISISDKQEVPVNISKAGFATLYYGALNLVIPEGVTANTATVDDKTITMAPVEGVIPAGTGVVLEGKPGDYNFTVDYNIVPAVEAENLLDGSDEDAQIAEEGYKYYILSTNKDNDPASVGFYFQVDGGASVSNKAHKAYLAVPEEVAAGASFFLFNEADGIQTVEVAKAENGEVYTLSGIRVNGKLNKGVYVVNGKKVVVK